MLAGLAHGVRAAFSLEMAVGLRERMGTTRIFHGWKMVGAGAGIQFMQAALLYQAFGAYFAALVEEKGWSRTALAGAAAMQPMEAALLGPVLGWIVDRFGPQGMIRLGILAMSIGFFILGSIDSLPGFYAAFIVIALGSSLCGFFPINVAIIHWFQRMRARALSSIGLGLALGGLAVPLVAGSIEWFGWRATAYGSGVVVLVFGWPLAQIFKRRPEDIGETVDGLAPLAGNGSASGPDADQPEFTARQALRTGAFWLISLGHGTALMAVYAVNVHAITHMRESLGYTLAEASLIITLMTASQVGGVLVGGWCGDRFDKRRVSALCMVLHAAGLLLLTWATNWMMLVGFALLHGGAWGLRGPFMQAIRADYFGRRAIGMILGLSALIIVFGQIGGPLIAGYLADRTGNYLSGFTLLAVLVGAGALFFLFARRPVHLGTR